MSLAYGYQIIFEIVVVLLKSTSVLKSEQALQTKTKEGTTEGKNRVKNVF